MVKPAPTAAAQVRLVTPNKPTPSEAERMAEKIYASAEKKERRKRLEVFVKTVSTATIACLVMKPIDQYNGQPWYFKVEHIAPCLKLWTNSYPDESITINEAFKKLAICHTVDVNDPSRNKQSIEL
ncbi:hypothetical protein SEMRO_1780_G297060.1 [Seminavis robusta]|uniref:Uncharacterized protein n=1 Tax=Seminavis robusta TaxID=568900 RepID=A0A9N8EV82_9STRA|nr:hypothetical protein SEMRO_1780_G297060.1 [Seminavis robusta]|eukprot:Sro1780_g297060.1 n/a (126) ;mRNA; f:19645-20022